jgi:hypothetical protein
VGFSKAKVAKLVRAAAVSGLLGAAGLTFTASPAWAGAGSDGASDGASEGASDGASDGATDGGTTTDSSDVGATDTSVSDDSGTLASTGSDATLPLVLGGAAVTIVLAGRRFLGSQP